MMMVDVEVIADVDIELIMVGLLCNFLLRFLHEKLLFIDDLTVLNVNIRSIAIRTTVLAIVSVTLRTACFYRRKNASIRMSMRER